MGDQAPSTAVARARSTGPPTSPRSWRLPRRAGRRPPRRPGSTGSWCRTTWCSARTSTPTAGPRAGDRGRPPADRSRRALARAADGRSPSIAGADRPRSASAPTSCSPRCAARSCWPRRPPRSTSCPAVGSTSASAIGGSARSTRRPGSTSAAAGGCSTTRSRSARRCGASSAPSFDSPELQLRGDPHDAEAGRVRRRADLGERHGQPTSVVARLARFGGGWIPWGDAPPTCTSSIALMRERVAACGRDPGDIGVVGSVVIGNGDVDPDAGDGRRARRWSRQASPMSGCHMSMSAPAAELTDRWPGSCGPSAPPSVGRERHERRRWMRSCGGCRCSRRSATSPS